MKIPELVPVFSVVFTVILISARGEPNHEPGNDKKNMTLLEGWQNMENEFKSLTKQAVKMLLPMLTENSQKVNLSKECSRNALHLISGIKDLKPWAFQFLDSSGKLWDGLLKGTVTAPGSYDECVEIMVNSTRSADKGKRLYNGQYCMVDIRPPLPPGKKRLERADIIPEELRNFSQRDTVVAVASKSINYLRVLPLRLGICTPTGCSKEDLNQVLSLLGDKIGVTIEASRCEVKEENEYTPVIIGVLTYYSFLTLLLICGTLISTYMFYTKTVLKNTAVRILLAFSFVPNFKKFSETNTRSKELDCLNGIRFLSMTSIICGHNIVVTFSRHLHGGMKITKWFGNIAFQAIINGTLTVDVFFFMSGLLLCYIHLGQKIRTPKFKLNVWTYVTHRLWRILPCYSFVIMASFLIPLMGSGPLWYETADKYIRPCYKNWWYNVIFINNFFDFDQQCIYHTWYVGADMQLYLYALIIMLPMIKWPKVGVVLSFLTILTCILYSGINAFVNNHPPIMLLNNLDRDESLKFSTESYSKPMSHASPYAIGILTGYLLITKPKLKIPPIAQVLGWCVAITSSAAALYGTANWNGGIDYTVVESIMYASIVRTAFTLGIAWMVICCATGHADIINHILSLKVFVPLARLTFLAYLIHPLVILVVGSSTKLLLQTDHFIFVWLYFGHLVASYGIAFIVYMLVELPFTNLHTILVSKPKKEENVKAVNGDGAIKDFNPEMNGKKTTVDMIDNGTYRPTDAESCRL